MGIRNGSISDATLSTYQIAELLDVHRHTVTALLIRGELKSQRLKDVMSYYREREIKRFMKERGKALNEQ